MPSIARRQNANPPAVLTLDRGLRHMARAEASDNLPTIRKYCVVHNPGFTGRRCRAGAPFRDDHMTLFNK